MGRPFGLARHYRAIHIWAAVTLTLDNRKARPQGYLEDKVVQASYSSRTMRMSGIILLAFIIFHIAHFTVRSVPGMQYEVSGVLDNTMVPLVKDGEVVMKNGHEIPTFNVNDMMVLGFENGWVSAFLYYRNRSALHAPNAWFQQYVPERGAS